MNITSVKKLTSPTAPEYVVTMLRRLAWKTLDHRIDADTAYELVDEALMSLGCQPPPAARVRWKTLLGYLEAFQRWSEAGPNHDETTLTEDDWLTMITGELVAVAGRAL